MGVIGCEDRETALHHHHLTLSVQTSILSHHLPTSAGSLFSSVCSQVCLHHGNVEEGSFTTSFVKSEKAYKRLRMFQLDDVLVQF